MLEKEYIGREQLEEAKKAQQSTRGDLAKILIDLGVNPRDVYEAKAHEMGVPFVDLSTYKPEQSALNVVPEHVAKRHNVIPLKKDGNILYVGMADPNNLPASDDLRLVSRCQVKAVLAAPDHIEDAISRLYGGTSVAGVQGATTGQLTKGGMNPIKAGAGASDVIDSDAKTTMAQVMAEYGARGDAATMEEGDEDALSRVVEEAPIVR